MDFVDPYEGLDDEDDWHVETSKPADRTGAKTTANRGKSAGTKKPAPEQPADDGAWTIAVPIFAAYLIWCFWFMFHYEDMVKNDLIFQGFLNLAFFAYTLFADPGKVPITCIRPDRTGDGLYASRKIVIVPLMAILLVCIRLVLS